MKKAWMWLLSGLVLAACGGDPTVVKTPKEAPVEAPILKPCNPLDSTYYPELKARPLRVRDHAISAQVDPASGSLTAVDRMTIEAVEPGRELVLFVDKAMTVEVLQSGSEGPGVSCGRGSLPAYQVLRLRFSEQLEVGRAVEVELHVQIAGGDFMLEAVQENPYPVAMTAQVDPASTFFATTPWYPMPIKSGASTATIEVTVPDGYTAVTSGVMRSATPAPEGGKTFTYAVTEPLRQTQPFGLVVGRDMQTNEVSSVEGAAFPLEQLTLRHVYAGEGGSNENTVVTFALMAGYLESMLGPWPLESLTVAEVSPSTGEMGSANPGLVIVSPGVIRAPEYGTAAVFSLMARQWIEVLGTPKPALKDGLELFLRFDYSRHQMQGERFWVDSMAKLRGQYLNDAQGAPEVPIADLSFIDALYIPTAFSKVPLALNTLALSIGEAPFQTGLRDFLRRQPASDEGLGVDALQAAMEASSGADLTGFFDLVFRSTAWVEVEASCRSGKVILVQKQNPVVTPLVLDVALGEGDAALRGLATFDGATATTEVACSGDASGARIEQTLARVR